MQEGEKRLAIAAVLTVAVIAVVNIYFGAIWRVWGRDAWAEAALLALLPVWIPSATVLWIPVSNNLRRPLRKRAIALSRVAWPDSSELRRDSDV